MRWKVSLISNLIQAPQLIAACVSFQVIFGQCLLVLLSFVDGDPTETKGVRFFCRGPKCKTGLANHHSEKMQYFVNLHSNRRKHGVKLPPAPSPESVPSDTKVADIPITNSGSVNDEDEASKPTTERSAPTLSLKDMLNGAKVNKGLLEDLANSESLQSYLNLLGERVKPIDKKESLSDIKSSILTMNIFNENEGGGVRPPYMFQDDFEMQQPPALPPATPPSTTTRPTTTTTSTASRLPDSNLASMAGLLSSNSPLALFKPVYDPESDSMVLRPNNNRPPSMAFAASTSSPTTTSTVSPFTMPSYFGMLLTPTTTRPTRLPPPTTSPIASTTDEDPGAGAVTDSPEGMTVNTTRIHHHFHHHHYQQQTPVDVQEWYMQHMSSILNSGSSTASRPTSEPPESSSASSTSTSTSAESLFEEFQAEAFPFMMSSSSSSSSSGDGGPGMLVSSNTRVCPAACSCTCPQDFNSPPSSTEVKKKIDLDLTLLPCSRTAAYQLDLAIKLCRRRRKK